MVLSRRLLAYGAPLALAATVFLPAAAEAQGRRAAPANVGLTNVGLTGSGVAASQRPLGFAAQPGEATGSLVLPLGTADDLAARAAGLEAADVAAVRRALASARFGYGARQTLSLRGIGGWDRILVVGLGAHPTDGDYQAAGAVAGRTLIAEPGPITVLAQGLPAPAAAELATGAGVGQYRSDLHRTTGRQGGDEADTTETPRDLGPVTVVADADAQALYAGRGAALVEAMAWARDVSNEPANVLYPESFVERARAAFAGAPGVSIEVFDVPALQRLGAGALLGVGAGSSRPPRLLVVRYRGAGAPEGQPLALVGKGITFDTGGISIKPTAGMGNMKMDMSGAASVVGATLALARSGAPVNVVAVAALAENMPDANAVRPADVLTALNGRTIEIISTDAEGRLVLADAVAWAEANVRPAAIIDLATLTGAVRTALGAEYAGLFSRHDALAQQLDDAGRAVGERLWRLPLHPNYANEIRSTTADVKNSGDGGPGAGVGAQFIGYFIDPETPWAHLDIAGVAYGAANDWKPAGSAAYGLRLLERFARDWRPVPRGAGDGGR